MRKKKTFTVFGVAVALLGMDGPMGILLEKCGQAISNGWYRLQLFER